MRMQRIRELMDVEERQTPRAVAEQTGFWSNSRFWWLAVFAVWTHATSGAIPGHPEIVVACDAKGNLVARFDAWPFRLGRFPGMSGFAAGMPGFSSLWEALPEEALYPPDAQSDLAFVLVNVDEGMAVMNDHGTA